MHMCESAPQKTALEGVGESQEEVAIWSSLPAIFLSDAVTPLREGVVFIRRAGVGREEGHRCGVHLRVYACVTFVAIYCSP